MDAQQRKALAELRLTWAPTPDDLWRSQGVLHVPGLNEGPLAEVMAAFDDAARADASPLGVVLQGPAGSGKTHMLGQVRERVQAGGGFFLNVELLDATSFWQSARTGILESLGRPGADRETQLKDLLWTLASIAHIPRADRRAIVGDDELTPETLDAFANALNKNHRETIRQCRHTLRALVLSGSADYTMQDIGDAFLQGNHDPDREHGDWAFPAPPATAQETVRDIARIIAIAGPSVLAVDQIDTLLAQSTDRTDSATEQADNRDLEHVAHGLMSIRQTMRRTVGVVACLPAAWESIRARATATVGDRFRVTFPLKGLPSAELGRTILERRFAVRYASVGFTPPYPSWPILPSAFSDAPDYTPRQLLKRADDHIRGCLTAGTVEELTSLHKSARQQDPRDVTDVVVDVPGDTPTSLDVRFAEYRSRAVTGAALDPEGEDTTVPELLRAALRAWIVERDGDGDEFRVDDKPGAKPALHARLRQSLDSSTDDEQHWAFRAIAHTNSVAVLNRLRSACSATGITAQVDRRRLYLLRNGPWPGGKKTAEALAEFEAAGGRTLPMSDDDLKTMIALRDLIDDDPADLPGWLAARKPAHGIALIRAALGDKAGELPPPVPEPASGAQAPDVTPPDQPSDSPAEPLSPFAIPLGADDSAGVQRSVQLLALRKHAAVFAGSGSGKTVLLRRIIEECALRGVSSIVLDPNNDLSRLGSAWPERPAGWAPADDDRAADYLTHTEVVVWTPNRLGGRPLSFQPLPDFASVADDPDEFNEAVESAVAALEPRALISGSRAKVAHARAVLKEALQWFGQQSSASLEDFIAVLADLPDEAGTLRGARERAAELAMNLRAEMINDNTFGGVGASADPGVLLTPSEGYRARVSVISMIGLINERQREGFVNQLQMALFSWIKRNPAGDRPLGGLLVMDEAQNFAPSGRSTISLRSTLALSSQARKYGLGLLYATQAPKGLHNHIPGNAASQFFGFLNSSTQIAVANELARVKGGEVPDISRLRAGNFYVALEGEAFHKVRSPWCLSHHPSSPPTTEQVLDLARRPLGPR